MTRRLITSNRAISIIEKEQPPSPKFLEYPNQPKIQNTLDFLKSKKKKNRNMVQYIPQSPNMIALELHDDIGHTAKRLRQIVYDGHAIKFTCPTCCRGDSALYQYVPRSKQ